MSRIAYVNGRYVRHAEASVHIEDRGYQLADGIYEVWAVMDGRLVDSEGHFTRLHRSLGELSITPPMDDAALKVVLHEVLRRNRILEGLLYLQVTRGVARRDHAFPSPAVSPAMVVTAKAIDRPNAEAKAAKGISVITTPENRWGRCDIKTVGLLPNALARQAAKEQGAGEAWFVDADGLVTEGAASNAWILTRDNVLVTRDTGANILRGVTRSTLIEVIRESNFRIEERPFTVSEALNAKEAFITGAGALVTPVHHIDGKPVGEGTPGELALRLRADYVSRVRSAA
ncbi:MAG: D-amino acid aminotransferase [Caulobacteraceae bacterium]|nr:D-amino acid aminotransferase [Caulobacteraceae bacterium]